jgi:MoaA/NifB/PqqE/SkfB family radical SAM enzyme
VAFAGGDPSLRTDLPELCELAKRLRLNVEIQTNAHSRRSTILAAFQYCDSIAVSIDGPRATQHDQIRGARGNFQRVLGLIASAQEAGVSVRVRSVITNAAAEDWRVLGERLTEFRNIVEWRLQELSPVGKGKRVHRTMALPAAQIQALTAALAGQFPDLHCRYVSSASKVGLYAMIRSDGQLYGTSGELDAEGYYPLAGSLLDEHLSVLADRLTIDADRHIARYS